MANTLGNIILTGATGGVGKEISKILYAKGANLLVISSKNEQKLQMLAEELSEQNGKGKLLPLAFDLTKIHTIDQFVNDCIRLLDGKLDILIKAKSEFPNPLIISNVLHSNV